MNSVFYWNDVALRANADDHTANLATGAAAAAEQAGPTRSSRALAIVHVAMADASAKLTGRFAPLYGNHPNPPASASLDAAIGSASWTTLTALYAASSQRANFDLAMQRFLASLSNVGAAPLSEGLAFGRRVAEIVLAERARDRSNVETPYFPSDRPGAHRVDPFHPDQGFLGTSWGDVELFAVADRTRAAAGAPYGAPDLASAIATPLYGQDFNEVRSIGARNSSSRTTEQRVVGIFWAYDGAQDIGTPPRLYNQVLRAALAGLATPLALADHARLFALFNVALADAGVVAWYMKYLHQLWRPVVGIREAKIGWGPSGIGDRNPNTSVDPFWEPLGAPRSNRPGASNFTPNFPSYPSGHATFGAAGFEIAKKVLLDRSAPPDLSFDFVSDEFDGRTRDSNSAVRPRHSRLLTLSKSIVENADSRIWLGVHWREDARGGVATGANVAADVYSRAYRPLA